MNITAQLHTAIEAALKAGERILDIYHNEDFDVDFKSDDSPLTKADTASHHIIMSYLEETGIPVLSEEGKGIAYETRKDWEYLWIVDPIDGTKEFIKKTIVKSFLRLFNDFINFQCCGSFKQILQHLWYVILI